MTPNYGLINTQLKGTKLMVLKDKTTAKDAIYIYMYMDPFSLEVLYMKQRI